MKQTKKQRPAKRTKNSDRASMILSLLREFPNNKFSLKHLASASGGATKEGAKRWPSSTGSTTKASSKNAPARNTASRAATCPATRGAPT